MPKVPPKCPPKGAKMTPDLYKNNKILSFNLITDEWKYYDLPSGKKVGYKGYTNQLIKH